MALTFDFIGTPSDSCRCGRRASKKHCPFCGSFQIKAYRTTRKIYDPETKFTVELTNYACEKCGIKFDETALSKCEAPEYLTKEKKALLNITRTARAIKDKQPLTKSEKVISKIVTPSLIAQLESDKYPINPATGEPIKGSNETYSEYLKRREVWLLSQQ